MWQIRLEDDLFILVEDSYHTKASRQKFALLATRHSLVGERRYPCISLDAGPAVVPYVTGRSSGVLHWVGHDFDALKRVQAHVRHDHITSPRCNRDAERVPEALGFNLRSRVT